MSGESPAAATRAVLASVPGWRFVSYFYGVNHVRRVLKRGRLVFER